MSKEYILKGLLEKGNVIGAFIYAKDTRQVKNFKKWLKLAPEKNKARFLEVFTK